MKKEKNCLAWLITESMDNTGLTFFYKNKLLNINLPLFPGLSNFALMVEGLKLTVTGMLTVFLFLGLLVGLIQIIGYFFRPRLDLTVTSGNSSGLTPAKVAAITGAVSAYENEMRD